jgi:D-alanyl-D-alanine carboxypeptidase/D-alanyl-D-alanine-endopeptidase (penicillin-binding protein 4)
VGAVIATTLAFSTEDDTAEAAPAAAPAAKTPLWSPRRAPEIFVQPAANVALSKALNDIVSPYDACATVSVDGAVVADVGTDAPLVPASTIKLLTATAALAQLGPEHRFRTAVLEGGGGDLVVVGGGDPLLATPEFVRVKHMQARFRDAEFTPLSSLVDAIAAAGVTSVNSIVVDDTRHDSTRFLPFWNPNYARDGEVGSLGALTVDAGFVDPVAETPADDPAIVAGERLTGLLEARGIEVNGGVRHGTAPADAREVAHLDSPPLAAVIVEMLPGSDNYTAEQILREVAADADPSRPATTDAGVAVAMRHLMELKIPLRGVVMRDGSGLARANQMTCDTLLHVFDLSQEPRYAAIDLGLSVAGRSGTMATRFVGDPLAGRLRAKTGSLNGVVGLVGTVDGDVDAHFAFLAAGGFSQSGGAQLQARIARAVAAYPDRSVARGLVPAP